MKRKMVVASVLAAILVACCTAVTVSTNGRLPTQATFTGRLERRQISDDPPVWSVRMTGTIQFAGLGVGSMEATFDRVELAPGGNNIQAGSNEGPGVITLLTGERLFGRFRWLTSPTLDPDVLTILAAMTLTGGTGRFATARGHGFTIGRGNVVTGQITGQTEGYVEGISPFGATNRRPRLTP